MKLRPRGVICSDASKQVDKLRNQLRIQLAQFRRELVPLNFERVEAGTPAYAIFRAGELPVARFQSRCQRSQPRGGRRAATKRS